MDTPPEEATEAKPAPEQRHDKYSLPKPPPGKENPDRRQQSQDKEALIFQAMLEVKQAVDLAYEDFDSMGPDLPAILTRCGVILVPEVKEVKDYLIENLPLELEATEAELENKGFRVTLQVDWYFFAADGSAIIATTAGEAIHYDGTATAKAQDHAMRMLLLQVFGIQREQYLDTPSTQVNSLDDLKAMLVMWLEAKRSKLVHKMITDEVWLAEVTRRILGRHRIELIEEFHKVNAAVRAGQFDWRDGKPAPKS